MGQWRQIDLPQRGEYDPEYEEDDDGLGELHESKQENAKNFRNHLSVFVDRF